MSDLNKKENEILKENFHSVASEPKQQDKLGILVLGYNRPRHLQTVLESLSLQEQLDDVHVWIDGSQGRGEYQGANVKAAGIARRYETRELRVHRSHLGIEKMMLDALDYMTALYSRLLILEDDCFPIRGAVETFEAELAKVHFKPEVYSVYGHHFGIEPPQTPDFPRFQGWGWGAHSDRIQNLLPELRDLFMMSEQDYCAYVADNLNEDIQARLDTTPGRNVLNVLGQYYSWDSATSFLTAQHNMVHRRTKRPVIVNTGFSEGIGHFQQDKPFLRKPPFNMIQLSEAWERYDSPKT